MSDAMPPEMQRKTEDAALKTGNDYSSEQSPESKVRPVERGLAGRFWNALGMLLTRTFIRLEGRGIENLPKEAPYILAANHETYVDGMWIASFLPKAHWERFCSLAAADLLTHYGPFGRIIMKVGRGVPLDRHGSPLHGLQLAREQLLNKQILLIHPEGTRSRDGRLGKIHDGAAFIARRANVPIVPVFIDGGYEVYSRHHLLPNPWLKPFRRRRVIIRFGEPIQPQGAAKEISQQLRQWLEDAYAHKEIPREAVPPRRPKRKKR